MKPTLIAATILAFLLAIPVLAQTPPATAPATAAAGQSSPAKLADIRELIKAAGLADLGKDMLQAFVELQKQQHPDLPADTWAQFQKSVDTSEFADLLVPMYDRHFSHAEVKELLTFWRTPTGQKLAREQFAMAKEANRLGATWWQRLADQFQKQLDAAKPATTTAPAK